MSAPRATTPVVGEVRRRAVDPDSRAVVPTPAGPCWTVVDLAALRHNVCYLRGLAPAGTALLAVVKADGYGHGAAPVARAALGAGAWGLGVARVAEGVDLRRAGVDAPVLVLSLATERELRDASEHDLALSISGWRTALALAALGRAAGRATRVHLEVDTGMHRYGVALAEARRFAEALAGLDGIELAGLYTHFATADEPESPVFAAQERRFAGLVRSLEDAGLRPPMVHAANSPATLRGGTVYDAVRTGLALYGIPPGPEPKPQLLPAMSLHARVGRVLTVPAGEGVSYGHAWVAPQDTTVAVVACGYADGYPWRLGGRGEVLIGGRRCPVLGRVCMDSMIVGLPPGLAVAEDAEAVLLGRQGEECVLAEELAARAETSRYEIVTGMGRRGERVYLG